MDCGVVNSVLEDEVIVLVVIEDCDDEELGDAVPLDWWDCQDIDLLVGRDEGVLKGEMCLVVAVSWNLLVAVACEDDFREDV